LELFLNSEYDPDRAEMDQISENDHNDKSVAKHRFLSAQVRPFFCLTIALNYLYLHTFSDSVHFDA